MYLFMRIIYTFLLYLFIPFILLRLYWKGRRLPAYRQRILERFSLSSANASAPVDIWLHAVSLGEVVAATPLIDALLMKQWKVLVTTMTPTGSQQVIKRFGQQVTHQYLPYDIPWALRRFFKKNQPRLGIIMETELWPNLIDMAKQMGIPLLLANARLSDQSFKSYEKVKLMFKPILQQFTAIFAQSEEDVNRFVSLGAPSASVYMLGNIKFDLQLPTLSNHHSLPLDNQWAKDRVVVIAASTHHDEEHQLLLRLNRLKVVIPNVLLVIAPRHPERFQAIYQLCLAEGFRTGIRSEPNTIDATIDVLVIDSLGELLGFYQQSDYAFVGGSLVPVGGHNVLEPIAMRVPVFCGPYMMNSKAICRDLLMADAMVMVKNADALIDAINAMHQNKTQRIRQIDNATAVLLANQGTVARYMEKIELVLQSRKP